MGGLQVQVPGPTRIPEIQSVIGEMRARAEVLSERVECIMAQVAPACRPRSNGEQPKIASNEIPVSTEIGGVLIAILTSINCSIGSLEDTVSRLEI